MPNQISGQTIEQVQTALAAGGVVILPTETVYGLAARADMSTAVERIYAIKGRDFDKPLAVCVRDLKQAETFATFDATSRQLAERYWPGSLTLVLPVKPGLGLDPRVTSGTEEAPTIALRCAEAAWTTRLDLPLALTSANRSGQPDCTRFETAMQELGDEVDGALSSDAPLSGAPSTIVAVREGQLNILRQGSLVVTEVNT